MLAAPFLYNDLTIVISSTGGATLAGYSVGPWIVDTFPEALVVAARGVVVGFVALDLLNLLAWGHAAVTIRLFAGR